MFIYKVIVCPSICLPVYLVVWLSGCLSVWLSVWLAGCLAVCRGSLAPDCEIVEKIGGQGGIMRDPGRIKISDLTFSWLRERAVVVSGNSDGSMSRCMVAGADAGEVFRL